MEKTTNTEYRIPNDESVSPQFHSPDRGPCQFPVSNIYSHQPSSIQYTIKVIAHGPIERSNDRTMDINLDQMNPTPASPGLYTATATATAISPATPNTSFAASPIKQEDASFQEGPPKKKQKRNKPTLSCQECVERKTKVRTLMLLCLLS